MRKIVEFDEFSRCCKYFKSSEDYSFECLHPEQEERETYNGRELGRCFSCSCPLGIEAEQEDYGAKDVDWDGECSDGVVPEGEYYSSLPTKQQVRTNKRHYFHTNCL